MIPTLLLITALAFRPVGANDYGNSIWYTVAVPTMKNLLEHPEILIIGAPEFEAVKQNIAAHFVHSRDLIEGTVIFQKNSSIKLRISPRDVIFSEIWSKRTKIPYQKAKILKIRPASRK